MNYDNESIAVFFQTDKYQFMVNERRMVRLFKISTYITEPYKYIYNIETTIDYNIAFIKVFYDRSEKK